MTHMAVVVKERICRQCGATFQGGPRAWYCPSCRAQRSREAARRFRAKGRKADRALGTIDKCVLCGKEYVVNAARQKYCPDCAYEGVRIVDRPQSRNWNAQHKDTYYPAKNAKRHKERYCIICGALITAKTPTVTCGNPECDKERIRQNQRRADAKRRERRNAEKRKIRYCVICGAQITAKTSTITCDNPECHKERLRQRQRAARAKQREAKSRGPENVDRVEPSCDGHTPPSSV